MAKEKISYDEAIREIETILDRIESGDLGVDELAEKVSRVNKLLKNCRDRLYKTEEEIDKILGEDTAPDKETSAPDGDEPA
jgi:exodeoxyribonuclease VII small subunit